MILDYKKIFDTDTSFYNDYFDLSPVGHHLSQNKGEHYKLLTYISNLYNDITILDLGTNWGESALALAQNKTNTIITYDIVPHHDISFLKDYSNIDFRLMDIANENESVIKSAKIIMLDIAHDGVQERNFTDMLSRIGYKGYLICDDIFCPYYPNMEPWWKSINIEKYDISEVGHVYGTGLVNYYQDNSVKIIK
jgi:hypothetical protein